MPLPVDLIVNPSSGPASARVPRAARLDFARRVLEASIDGPIRAVESRTPGSGAAAARRAVAEGVARVVVWGGDGTLNAVAAELAGSATALAVIPGGSGNGFARGLGIPLDVAEALRLAARGAARAVDTGLADGRPFINLAGMGLDAAIAHRFNVTAGTRRGLASYVRACFAEVGARPSRRYRVRVDGQPWFAGPADVVVIANGGQYGHGARIAPLARVDDGLLDVVVVPDVTHLRVCRHGWRLFNGTLERVPRVRMTRGGRVEVDVEADAEGGSDLLLHRDGEVDAVTAPLVFTVQPRHLLVVTP